MARFSWVIDQIFHISCVTIYLATVKLNLIKAFRNWFLRICVRSAAVRHIVCVSHMNSWACIFLLFSKQKRPANQSYIQPLLQRRRKKTKKTRRKKKERNTHLIPSTICQWIILFKIILCQISVHLLLQSTKWPCGSMYSTD